MKRNSILIASALTGSLVLAGYILYPLFQNKPKIYGLTINLNGSGGHQIVDVNFDTGLESNPRSLGIATSVYGLARKYVQSAGQNEGVVTAIEEASSACGSGTAFYVVDLNTGSNVKRGIAQGKKYIKDIEYNPIDNKLYGIYNAILIRVDNLGTCAAGTNGSPAQITELGKLGNVGSGPYSVSFDHLGTCYIISGKDHHRAAVQLPLIPNSSVNLNIIGSSVAVDASWSIPLVVTNINEASCISGVTQIIGLSYAATPSIPNAFFHFGNPNWTKKGTPWQIIDYTSTAKKNSWIK